MAKVHSEKWFAKQEARLQEPIKNTMRFYTWRSWAMIATAPTVLLLPVAIKGIIKLVRVRRNLKEYLYFQNDYIRNGRMVTNDGPPGTGKTFTGSNIAYFLALGQWAKLKSDYFTQRSMLAQWVKEGNTVKLESFKALEESYIFYAEREAEHIPCLVSSIPLREYGTGRTSYVLDPEIFLQIARAPEYTVFFNDESGQLFGAEKSKKASPEAADFWRFHRHFLDGMAINTNQDGNQNMIQIRRSTDYVNHLSGQEWLCKPDGLLRKIKKKEQKFYKKLRRGKLSEEKANYIAQELYFMDKYAHTIGFRQVTHQLVTPQGGFVGEKEYYIFPAIGGVEYDDRCFRNLYKCKDKPIELRAWDKLAVEQYDRSVYDSKITGNTAGGEA